jgi:hypothetical protein
VAVVADPVAVGVWAQPAPAVAVEPALVAVAARAPAAAVEPAALVVAV